MKTYIIVTTNGKEWQGKIRRDFAIFTSMDEVVKFVEGKPALNYLDDATRLYTEKGEFVERIHCILAEGPVEATNRAWQY